MKERVIRREECVVRESVGKGHGRGDGGCGGGVAERERGRKA